MLSWSVTFGPKSIENRPQQGNFFKLTTPNTEYPQKDNVHIFHLVPIGTLSDHWFGLTPSWNTTEMGLDKYVYYE